MGFHQGKTAKGSTKQRDSQRNGKRFANQSTDRPLLLRLHKELEKLNNRKTNNPVMGHKEALLKDDTQNANRHRKQCEGSPAINETRAKATTEVHLTPVRIAII